jgi:hypothetical protein
LILLCVWSGTSAPGQTSNPELLLLYAGAAESTPEKIIMLFDLYLKLTEVPLLDNVLLVGKDNNNIKRKYIIRWQRRYIRIETQKSE